MQLRERLKNNSRDLLLLLVLGVIGVIAFFPILGSKIWGSHFIPKIDYARQYDIMLEKNPNRLDIVYLRGLQRCHQGNYKGALEDMNRCLSANPGRRDALVVRCTAYYKLKNYLGALDDINKVLYYDRQDEDYWLMRADVYEALGRKDLADKDLAESKKFATPKEWKRP
jgi:tetratricopeptide (TPR) repeat protein